jgi:hypothetical protein
VKIALVGSDLARKRSVRKVVRYLEGPGGGKLSIKTQPKSNNLLSFFAYR